MEADFKEIQANEIEALKAIFMEDFQEFPGKGKSPSTHFAIILGPQGVDKSQWHVSVALDVNYSKKYPSMPPELKITPDKGLSEKEVKELTKTLRTKSNTLLDQEMIYDLTLFVQDYLTSHNREQVSFFEAMTTRKEKENALLKQAMAQQQKMKEDAEDEQRKHLENEIQVHLKKKEELQKAEKKKLQTRSSDDDEDSDLEKNFKKITVASIDLSKIHKGNLVSKCGLGNLHAAFDPKSGQLLSLREVKIGGDQEKADLIQEKIKELEREVTKLTKFHHPQIIPHFGSRITKAEKFQTVEIITETLAGDSLESLLRKYGALQLNKACDFGQKLLVLIAELHEKQVTIKGFDSSMVYFNDKGEVMLLGIGYYRILQDMAREDVIRVSKGDLVPFPWSAPEPMDWSSVPAIKKYDIWYFGCLFMEMLVGPAVFLDFTNPTQAMDKLFNLADENLIADQKYSQLQDFLSRALSRKPKERQGATELLKHPLFGRSPEVAKPQAAKPPSTPKTSILDISQIQGAPSTNPMPLPGLDPFGGKKPTSRFEADFEVVKRLGKGGFGEVVKARNKLDGRFYAVKKIKLNAKDMKQNRRYLREVATLSRLHHEYVVRYYQAWIEEGDPIPPAAKGEGDESFTNDSEDDDEDDDDDDDDDDDEEEESEENDVESPKSVKKEPVDKGKKKQQPKSGAESDEENSEHALKPLRKEKRTGGKLLRTKSSDNDDSEDDSETSGDSSDSDGSEDSEDSEDRRNYLDEFEPQYFDFGAKEPEKIKVRDFGAPASTKEIQEEDQAEVDDLEIDFFGSNHQSGNLSFDGTGIWSSRSAASKGGKKQKKDKAKGPSLYLCIQMEYCSNGTLRELIDEQALDESESWRLFRQILEGLTYIHSLTMIHRDLKPNNIFLDANGNAKIGDFGLATLGQQGSDKIAPTELDNTSSLTSNVGTPFYVSPEVKEHSVYTQKVDVFSLGIVFFEMCHRFSTGMERIDVLTTLRQRETVFPKDFEKKVPKQAKLIHWMLLANPEDRPTSSDVLKSDYLPPKMEDEKIMEALKTIANPNTSYFNRLMETLFAQKVGQITDYTYDWGTGPQPFLPHLLYNSMAVIDTVEKIFRRHGAVDLRTPLLVPRNNLQSQNDLVTLMDKSGNLVNLPYDLTLSFARFLARSNITHLKRFNIDRVFRYTNAGQPIQPLECDFDIVDSTSISNLLPEAEVIKVSVEILQAFPAVHNHGSYLRVSHSKIAQAIFDFCQIAPQHRVQLGSVLTQLNKLSWSQVKKLLQRQNILSESSFSKLENILLTKFTGENEDFLSKIGSKLSDSKVAQAAIKDVRLLLRRLRALDVKCKMVFDPSLMYNLHYFNGVIFQVALQNRNTKEIDILGAGGRYDELVSKFRHTLQSQPICAVGVNLAIEKLIALNFTFQQEVHSEKELPLKRTDVEVYVCSVRSTLDDAAEEKLLNERLLVASELWAADISTEVMHVDEGHTIEELQMMCKKMGYSWMVIILDKGNRITPTVKVKSVTKKIEVDISRPGLVDFLRKTLTTGSLQPENSQLEAEPAPAPSVGVNPSGVKIDVNVLLDTTGQKKSDFKKKNSVISKANERFQSIRKQMIQQKMVEILAVDLPQAVLRALVSVDVESDVSFKVVLDLYPAHRKYLATVREAMLAARKKSDIFYLVLYSFKDEVAENYTFWR